ncbi:MAG: protein-glutamate O-methyltransferase [Pseudomonadota bacterium]
MTVQLALKPEARRLADPDLSLDPETFAFIASMLKSEAGIALGGDKAPFVSSRLTKRLRALGLKTFDAYRDLIEKPGGAAERAEMVCALTTNVTRFFREHHHFEDLTARVLRPIAPAVRRGARLRLWSAACSSGEEAYSMAIEVLSVIPNAADLDIRILATDIDANILNEARSGVYDADDLGAISEKRRVKWFETLDAGRVRVRDEVRGLVSFRRLNLFDDWPMTGTFDAVFCRNVVIYFDTPSQTLIWSRFSEKMQPGARLYVGHSERVSDAAFELDGVTTYVRRPV